MVRSLESGRGTESLPQEIADRFTRPLANFIRIEAASGITLLISTLCALALANSPWSTQFLTVWETEVGLHVGSIVFDRSLRQWINDGAMTIFFFVVALELKRELVLGELRDWRMAALPLAGALGGMIVPAGLYAVLMAGKAGAHGWGTVMATDTAFVIGCLAIFGKRISPSMRVFLLSLAIFDDVGAITIVALRYGEALSWQALAGGALSLAMVAGIARLGIRSMFIYSLLGGAVWLCFDSSGVHGTISGVLLGMMTPTRVWVSDARLRAILGRVLSYPAGEHGSGDGAERHDLQEARIAAREAISPVERLELMLHPWVGFAIMPIFALANAGVAFTGDNVWQPVSAGIFVGLAFGKPLGVLGFSWLAVRLGFALKPLNLTWPLMVAGGFLTGIGFTMSLFIAGLAYPPAMLVAAKTGILLGSLFSGATGLLMLAWLTFRNSPAQSSEQGRS